MQTHDTFECIFKRRAKKTTRWLRIYTAWCVQLTHVQFGCVPSFVRLVQVPAQPEHTSDEMVLPSGQMDGWELVQIARHLMGLSIIYGYLVHGIHIDPFIGNSKYIAFPHADTHSIRSPLLYSEYCGTIAS